MRRTLPILVIALVLSACASTGADDPITDDDPQPSAGGGTSADGVLVIEEGSTASGPGISVTDALEYTGAEPVLVNGALFIDADGGVLLCEAIAESFPPQCGGNDSKCAAST